MSVDNKRWIRNELKYSTTGYRTSKLEIVTDTKTGESTIELSYQVSESMELNEDNLKVMKDKYKDLNPSSGWIVEIDNLIRFINDGQFEIKQN